MKILLNIINQFIKGFYVNRPISADTAILAYFSAKIFFASNKLIFQKNNVLYFLKVIFRPHGKKIKIGVSRAPQSLIIASNFDIMMLKNAKKSKFS